jgi:hypothetical protein
MNNEEFEQFVRSALRLKKPPEVSEEEMREFLATPTDLPPGAIEETRALVLEKAFRKFHPSPIWRVDGEQQFGPWFKALRQNVRLPLGEIAAGIDEPRSFIEQLEEGSVQPWQIAPDSLAKLMILYRVHFSAVKNLVSITEGATTPVAPPPRDILPGAESRAMMVSPESLELIPEVSRWLEELQAALLRRKAGWLLDFSSIELTLGPPKKPPI